MKVSELIKQLSAYPDDMNIIFYEDRSWHTEVNLRFNLSIKTVPFINREENRRVMPLQDDLDPLGDFTLPYDSNGYNADNTDVFNVLVAELVECTESAYPLTYREEDVLPKEKVIAMIKKVELTSDILKRSIKESE
jgi:hypothetical protein